MDDKDYRLRYLHFGVFRYKPGAHSLPFPPRPFDILSFIRSGEVDFFFPDVTLHAVAGDTVHIPMGSTYSMIWHGPAPENIAMFYQLASGAIHYAPQVLHGLALPLDTCPTEPLERLAKAYSLLLLCLPKMQSAPKPTEEVRLLPATEYIRSHYRAPLAPEKLAALIGVSLPRFYALFRQATGVCVTDYRNRVRVDVAIQLLLSTEQSVEEIADAVGFSSAIYFRRIFKKETGMTPSAYRKASRSA